jgi:hypothetical protein
MITRVIHVRNMGEYRDAVYIGRANGRLGLPASPFANPFVIGRDGTRQEVIEKYRAWILSQPHLVAEARTLRGRVLACWCAPAACHGDVLAAIADERTPGGEVPSGNRVKKGISHHVYFAP